MPASDRYDLMVIGSGPAGEKGAVQAAYFGKRVALVECSKQVGGSCVNTAAVPSKTLRESVLYFSGLRQRGLHGIDYSLQKDLTMGQLTHHKDRVGHEERTRVRTNLENHRVELVHGFGRFEDPHTLSVDRAGLPPRRLQADVFLIATGSRPRRPPEIAFDDRTIFDSDSILFMDRIPKSIAVVGGGVIGSEYASIFAALGLQVALVDGRDRLLPFLDRELSERLQASLARLGVQFFFRDHVERIEKDNATIRLRLRSGSELERDSGLFAAGRRGAVDGLGLERLGIAVNDRGHIQVNQCYQTSLPHIYAAGDVIGFPSLASTSMEQARVAACHAFHITYKQRVSSMLPLGIYTIPEISAVGYTEDDCRQKGIDFEVGRARYLNNTRGQIIGDTTGLLKLVFDRHDHALLGVHVIGENATELVHLGLLALEHRARLETFIETVFNYPSLSEMFKYAAYDGLGNLAGRKFREG